MCRSPSSYLNNRERKRSLWIFLFGSVHKNGVCYWCERKLKFEASTFDHNPPISYSNSHPNSGVISCEACNHNQVNRKRGYPPTPNYQLAMSQQNEIDKRLQIKRDKQISQAWEIFLNKMP